MSMQQIKRSLTDLITSRLSNIDEREIKEHLYNKFFRDQMNCKPLHEFLEKLNKLLSNYNTDKDNRSFSIKAGGKAWELFYKEEVAEAEKEKAAEAEKAAKAAAEKAAEAAEAAKAAAEAEKAEKAAEAAKAAAEAEKAAETAFQEKLKKEAFQPLNSDIFIFCDNNLINKIFEEINKLLEEFNDSHLKPLNKNIKSIAGENKSDKKISFKIEKVSLDKSTDRPIETILFRCHSFRVIYDYWLNDNIIFNGHILYVSFFPVESHDFNDFKNKFTVSYIKKVNNENYLNNEGLHFFGNKIDGNRSLEKGMNIDKIRMQYLMNYYKSQEQLPRFHEIYDNVFGSTELYSCYDKIKLNHLYFADIVDPIKRKIKKSVVQCFREYSYLILKDIEKEFESKFGKGNSITLLVGGESMSFYGITEREDTDDYDMKVFYNNNNDRECAIKIMYEILSKYVVLLKKEFPLEKILLQHKDVSLKSEKKSLARLRLIKSICKDYDLFSIDFKIIVEKCDNNEIESIAIDIPILDVSIVKKDINKFKSMFDAIAKKMPQYNQEINIITKDVDIIISEQNLNPNGKRERDPIYKEQQGNIQRPRNNYRGSIPQQNTDSSEVYEKVQDQFIQNKEEMKENITVKYFEDIDSQKNVLDEEAFKENKEVLKETANEAGDVKMEVEDKEAGDVKIEDKEAGDVKMKQEVETEWKIKIPTLLYYIYDYYYMYGDKDNKKLRILAQKNEKDQGRYTNIKAMIASSLNENMQYVIDYNEDFNKFLCLSHNSEKIMTDINFYREQFEALMISEHDQPKIKMPFKKDPDHMTIGGGENNQYSYFLADLFQNILDSIFFYHKSF
jgi:hypothetical protein